MACWSGIRALICDRDRKWSRARRLRLGGLLNFYERAA